MYTYVIITDKLRLNQVLLNIVSNAIEFTPVGGTISIRALEKACSPGGYATYEFRVKDNGIGIRGTGLGMAITKNILDMMGGTISVKSEEGKEGEENAVL